MADTVVELITPGVAQGVVPVPMFPLSIEVPYGMLGERREVGEGVSSQGVAVIQLHQVQRGEERNAWLCLS